MKYKISEYAKLNHVTYRTVWNWIKDGKLDVERTSTGRIQIVIDDAKEQVVAIYARVSSSENKDNLDRQAQRLIDYCKVAMSLSHTLLMGDQLNLLINFSTKH